MVNVNKLSTEGRNYRTDNIDILSISEILQVINEEDQTVAYAVKEAIPQIVKLVEAAVDCLKKGGRLIYLGAGTSGRIGLIDATECPPTFGVSPETIQCLMAGGLSAMTKAVEGAEDSLTLGIEDLQNIGVNKNDLVVGIAASGRTPYVVSAISYCKKQGIQTGSITTCKDSQLSLLVDFPIEAVTGAEPISGSTRMKSGTAQKLICNMISTCTMIKMGHVYKNLMVDVLATNEKLVARAHSIIEQATGMPKELIPAALVKYGSIKKVILSYLGGIDDPVRVEALLEKHQGYLREALKEAHDE